MGCKMCLLGFSQGHMVDYRNLIQDAVKGSASNSIKILPCASDFSVGPLELYCSLYTN